MENKGKRWSKKEEEWLLEAIQTHPVDHCAGELQRTPGAVYSRLQKVAKDLHQAGKTAEEIQQVTKISPEEVAHLVHVASLANYGASWDDEQDTWLQTYVKKLGIEKCAEKMERTPKELTNRLFHLAIEGLQKGTTVEQVANEFHTPVEVLEKKLEEVETGKRLDQIEELGEYGPYYVVLVGRRPGIYATWDACRTATIGMESKYKKCMTAKEVREYVEKTTQPSKVPTPISLPTLSPEQEAVMEDIRARRNILLLGSAGTGKTTIIRHLIHYCKVQGLEVGLTGTTGTAALLIDGKTLHSFLGIGLAKDSPQVLASTLFYKFKGKVKQLRELQILVIDEVSMLYSELLDKVSAFLAIVRNIPKPFGGVQIILCGDFYQLPPVEGAFAFQANVWDRTNLRTHILEKVFRQEGDQRFLEILERAKQGAITDEDVCTLQKCKDIVFPEGIEPTRLYSVNRKVDAINQKHYLALKGEEVEYKTVYSNKESQKYVEAIGLGEPVRLKIGAQVMVTRNFNNDPCLVNGTRGVVIGMYKDHVTLQTVYGEKDIGRFDVCPENEPMISYKHMPLKLAWALTIHKSQGATLDCAEIDLGPSIFEYGQGYVGLSRVRNLASVRITEVVKEAFRVHPDVKRFYEEMGAGCKK